MKNLTDKLMVNLEISNGERDKNEKFLEQLCLLERGLTFDDDYLTYREDKKVLKIKKTILTSSYLIYPMQELLIWSVAINEPSLTKLFLIRCDSGLQDRLMVATMYKSYYKILVRTSNVISSDRIQKIKDTKKDFLVESLKILAVADSMCQIKAGIMIRRECPRWGHLSILQIASKSKHLRLFENCVFQRTISKIWRGQINWKETNLAAYFISVTPVIGWILVPTLVHTKCIQFHSNNAYGTRKGTVG